MNPETFFENFAFFADAPNGVQKLRELILQLAVQGKLVPQNPEDEPASEFLEKIRAEKDRLIKDKAIKRIQFLPPITSYEIPFELPAGWQWVRLNDIFNFIDYRGKTPNKTVSGIRLITAKNIKKGFINLQPEEYVSEETYYKWMNKGLPKYGDILFTTEAPLGNVARVILTEKFALAQRTINLQPYYEFDTCFIKYSLMSNCIQSMIEEQASGMTAKGIKGERLKLIPVPFPPKTEHNRIASKIDQLMSLCDELETRKQKRNKDRISLSSTLLDEMLSTTSHDDFQKHWQRICDNFHLLFDNAENVNKLRQTVLQLAVRGKLVPQNPNDEPASELLKKVKAEKDRLVKEKKIKSGKPIPAIKKEEIPYELPKGWEWTQLGRIGLINPRNVNDDETLASFVPMPLVPSEYGEEIKTETKKWGEIKTGFTHFAENDVVLAKITPCFQNGKSAVMRNLLNGFGAGTTELHVFRSIADVILPEYLLIYLKTPKFISEGIPKMTGSAGQKRVPRIYFVQTPFPLPPLNEQKKIVAKTKQILSYCEQLNLQIKQAQTDIDNMLEYAVNELTGIKAFRQEQSVEDPEGEE